MKRQLFKPITRLDVPVFFFDQHGEMGRNRLTLKTSHGFGVASHVFRVPVLNLMEAREKNAFWRLRREIERESLKHFEVVKV